MMSSRASWLFNRLDSDQRGPEVVAYPERRRIASVIHVDAADVRHARQQVFDDLIGLRVDADDAVVVHPARPRISSRVGDGVVDIGPWRAHRPLLELLGL